MAAKILILTAFCVVLMAVLKIEANGAATVTGIVKWYQPALGYGFITPDDGSEDIFVHYTDLPYDQAPLLKGGQRVSFEIEEGPVTQHAVHVRVLELDHLVYGKDEINRLYDYDNE